MKLFKLIILSLIAVFSFSVMSGQSNAGINILTQNSGIVNVGGSVFLQVTINSTGPTTGIPANTIVVTITVPSAIVSIPGTGHQLPAGWVNLGTDGEQIFLCNGSDVIPVGASRNILIAIQGNTIGGPLTIAGSLDFSNGTDCANPGTLAGDSPSDNNSTSTIAVQTPGPCVLTVSASAGTIACNGGTTTLTATPTGASGTIEYSITGGVPFQTSNTFIVPAGNYTVTARQVTNLTCTATSNPVSVTQPTALTAPLIGTVTQPTCTTATGSVDLSGLPIGNWTINPGNISGNTSTTTINSLAPGTYNFAVTNSSGCVSPASANVIITSVEVPAAPVINITQPTCTVLTGIITVTSSTANLHFSLDGGTYATYPAGGYIVAAGAHSLTAQNGNGCISPVMNITVNAQPPTPAAPNTGAITQPTCTVSSGTVVLNDLPSGNWTINPGNVAGNTSSATINGLAPGTYNFTVTNSSGCTSIASANVVINGASGAPPSPTIAISQPTCTVATGTITITSSTTGFTFSLDGGSYVAYPAGGYVVTTGSHTLIAQDAGGCISAVTTITVDAQPATPAAPVTDVAHPTCTVSTGIITITSSTTGLTFSLDGGAYEGYPVGGYVVASGGHTLSAKNPNGCISSITNVLVNAQAAVLTITGSAGTIECFSGTTTLNVMITGGVPPYEYSLNGGSFQSANTFTVSGGNYIITVRDANLCMSTSPTIIVTQPTIISATTSVNIIDCNGSNTITVAAAGGTGTLQYRLDAGSYQTSNSFIATPGSHTITVKDANNCTTVTAPIVITQPTILKATATAPRITECGGTTVVTVTALGGSSPYTSGIGTFTRGAGTWTFSVTDAAGCTVTTEITIEAPGCVNLEVFPNPAGNSIHVNHSIAETGSTMQVFSVTGALLLTKQIPENAFLTTIDISKLAAGNYLLVFWNGKDKKGALFQKITL